MEKCAICGVNDAFGKGEHVFPNWYLGDADKAGPPLFAWSSNGTALVNRDKDPLQFQIRQRLLLPACESCNSILNTRFEEPAKPVVRRLEPNQWMGHADQTEWSVVGLWLAKILSFATHRRARYQHPEINKHHIRGDWDTEHFSWLIDGSPPPADLSLWVFRSKLTKEIPRHGIWVPRAVLENDGTWTAFPFAMMTLDGICATLLFHPGWPIEHPLVQEGLAWELLHGAGSGDLANLPVLSYNAVRWRARDAELIDGVLLDGGLPSLRATTDAPLPPEIARLIRMQL